MAEDYDFIGVSPSNLVDGGTFFWMAAPVEDNPDVAFMEALLDGLRRLDENAMMGPHMPDLDDVYVRDDARVSRMAREVLGDHARLSTKW